MKRLMLGLAMATLVMARPELYKEKEDFQYSRSSSDEGSKSGFYDAQRGNMGGNYERAHNMDSLAQHQMGGLVRQVEGELGDGSKMRTGSVYSSANSRGVYGSGRYDLSNLAGRNFNEGVSYGDSQSASSSNSAYTSQSSSHNNARYRASGHSSNSDYRGYQASNLQDAQNLYGASQFEQGAEAGHSSMYHSRSGYEGQNVYRLNADQFAAQNLDSNTHRHRLISTVPVKIIVRPGQSIAVPIATQTHSGSQIASYYDQNAVNSDAEVLNTDIHHHVLKPSNNAKHYESSYNYRKEWEKHDTQPSVVPLSIPTAEPIPKNSELYDDSYQHGSQYSSRRHEQNVDFNAASSQSHHQTEFDARSHSAASSHSNLNAYNQGEANSKFNSQSANHIGALGSVPKSYQSSYSYHKSWERQGDPYVIKPASNGAYEAQTSDRLTDASDSQAAYNSYNYGSRKTQNQQRYRVNNNCMVECEPSHSRVARSYNSDRQQFEQQSEDLGQQTQNQWEDFSELGQQAQANWGQTSHLEDLGQQTQNQWENLGQETQEQSEFTDSFGQQRPNSENLEDLGQQTQNQWDNLAELGQQTQQQSAFADSFGQQMHKENLDSWSQTDGQQTQNKWDSSENLGQQTQNTFENLEDLGQQVHTTWDSGSANQHSHSRAESSQDLAQQTQSGWNTGSTGQQSESKLDEFGQSQLDHGQRPQDYWDKQGNSEQSKNLDEFGQQSENEWHQINREDVEQSQANSHSFWDKLGDLEQTQKSDENQESVQHPYQHDLTQQTSGIWNMVPNQEQSYHETSKPSNPGSLSSLWGKIDNLDDDYTQHGKSNENNYFSQSSSSNFNHNWHQEEIFNHTEFTDKDKSTESATDNRFKIETIKSTTPKADAEKGVQPQMFNNIGGHSTTTSEKAPNILNSRPIDIGRGDIGPEESLTSTSTDRQTNTLNNNEGSSDIVKTSSSEDQKEWQVLPLHKVTSKDNKMESSTQLVISKDSEELAKPQSIEKELETSQMKGYFQQNGDYGQESQHFIDSMKHFEGQNSYQQNTDELPMFSQQNKELEQQTNWNVESQNAQQQFGNDFSQQNEASVQDFDQQFVDFGQQQDTVDFQNQQFGRNSDARDNIPEEVNFDNDAKAERSHDWKLNQEPEMEVKRIHVFDNYAINTPQETQLNAKSQTIELTTAEPTTEKPGFWKSVGNKLSSAKNRVASWFGS